jgi:hypothetical protein
MTSDNTARSSAHGHGKHVCPATSTPEGPAAALLPRRDVGASAWPRPARPMAPPPHPDLLVAVIDGLRSLDLDVGPR